MEKMINKLVVLQVNVYLRTPRIEASSLSFVYFSWNALPEKCPHQRIACAFLALLQNVRVLS